MPINNVNRVKSIALKLASNDSRIQTIYENRALITGDDFMSNYKIISVNCFIKNLKVFASINSLPESPLPEFTLEDTATSKRMKVLDVEWKSPRKQLNLYITNNPNPEDNSWLQVGSVSLLNTYGYPFKIYNVMDLFTDNLALELGENGKIGVQIQDVGYGMLSTTDIVTVHGSYMEEIFTQSPDIPTIVNINLSGIAGGIVIPTTHLLDNSSSIDNTFLIAN